MNELTELRKKRTDQLAQWLSEVDLSKLDEDIRKSRIGRMYKILDLCTYYKGDKIVRHKYPYSVSPLNPDFDKSADRWEEYLTSPPELPT